MAQQIISNWESGLVVRTKLNDNFTELYGILTAIKYSYTEKLTPTWLNTLPDLTYTPVAWSVLLFVNWIEHDSFSSTFSVILKTITWNNYIWWYDIEISDRVTVKYLTASVI